MTTTQSFLYGFAIAWFINAILWILLLLRKLHDFHDACEAEDLGPERDAGTSRTKHLPNQAPRTKHHEPSTTNHEPRTTNPFHFPGETHAETVPNKADIIVAMQPFELDTRTAQIQHPTPSATLR
jgi:hypothetical protein